MGKRIMLIADDSFEDREILKEVFKSDFDVIAAENGREAYEILLAKRLEISVILLDIFMPIITGHEFLSMKSKDFELNEIPVIVLSASDLTSGNELISLNLGAWDFVVKPFNAQIMIQKVYNVISRHELQILQLEKVRLEENAINNEKLRHLAEHDNLTDFWNIQPFCYVVKDLLKNEDYSKYAIIRYDINGFKVINDLYSFYEGDNLIRYIADVSKKMFPKNTIFCRVYGDSFVACCRKDLINYDKFAKNFAKALGEYQLDFNVLPSFGIYEIVDPNISVGLMCDRALIALRTIKNNYMKSYAIYDDSFRKRILEEQKIVNAMNEALLNEEFEVYFQPLYDYVNCQIVGAEALIRWNTKEGEILLPSEFIPVFEKNGFITKVDEYVWERACKWLRSWMDNHKEEEYIPISVNISRVDITNGKLFERLSSLVEKYNIPPSMLRLEITESAYMDNPIELIKVVRLLQDYGFILEMDDFGSGFSSLNTLKDLPVDILKLDMKFIKDIGNSGRGGNILHSIIRMVKWLNMPIIAEGVETKKQAEYLKSMGCYLIQGYFFAQPMPIKEFNERLEKELVGGFNMTNENDYINEDFWNLDSQVSLIFNSYVGAVGIFEYHDGEIEILRINDQYCQVIGVNIANHEEYRTHLLDAIHPKYRSVLVDDLEKAIRDNTECISTSRWCRPISQGDDFWIRVTARVISKRENRYLFYGLIENVTALVEAEKRLQLLEETYRLVLTSLDIFIFDYNPVIDEANCILFSSDGIKELKYVRYLENILKNSKIHPSFRAIVKESILEASKRKTQGVIECRIDVFGEGYEVKKLRYMSVEDEEGEIYRVIGGFE